MENKELKLAITKSIPNASFMVKSSIYEGTIEKLNQFARDAINKELPDKNKFCISIQVPEEKKFFHVKGTLIINDIDDKDNIDYELSVSIQEIGIDDFIDFGLKNHQKN